MNTVNTTTNTTKPGSTESVSGFKIFLLGLYHIFMVLLLVYLLVKAWPSQITGEDGKLVASNSYVFFGWIITAESESGLLLLVMIAAALGSYIHAATSFVSYVGNKSLVMSWAWWYILRPFIGMALALVFYFVIRGGLLSAGTDAGEISVFGITAVAGLVGMFSKQATDKLGEVFNTLFRTKGGEGDDIRKDKLGEMISVQEKMIPLNKISYFTIPSSKSLSDIKLEELYELLNETVTRIPILNEDKILLHLIHQSVIYKYISEQSIIASENKKSFEVSSLTLEDFLTGNEIKYLVTDAIAFVAKDATMLNAKDAMESIKNCQDVFITETGSMEEKVIGWLTNVDISKSLSV
jgi:hypothetical protein